MPTTKELAIRTEDRPGILGKVCRSLGDRGVNILAFQSAAVEGKALIRMVVDNVKTAEAVLQSERLEYTENPVAQLQLTHRPGELARVTAQLGEANININYAYNGVEPATNGVMLIFGVSDVGRATAILDKAVAAA
jgi:hypothetical protein